MVIIVGEEESLLFVKVNSVTLARVTPCAIINIAARSRERGAARRALTPHLKLTYFFQRCFLHTLSQRIHSSLWVPEPRLYLSLHRF